MEQFFIAQLWEGVKTFFANMDMVFVVVFILVTALINFGAKHPNKVKWLNWTQTYPVLFVFSWGVLMAIVYAFLNDLGTKVEITKLLYSVIFGMVLWKLVGINKLEKWIQTKFWNSKP